MPLPLHPSTPLCTITHHHPNHPRCCYASPASRRPECLPGALPQELSLELDGAYTKAFYRRAAGNFALGKYKAALKDFRHVCKLEPKDRGVSARAALELSIERSQLISLLEAATVDRSFGTGQCLGGALALRVRVRLCLSCHGCTATGAGPAGSVREGGQGEGVRGGHRVGGDGALLARPRGHRR